jgi:hypothetical protein
MAIKETFRYTNYTISIEEWVATLTDIEQEAYAAARIRQTALRTQAIAAGLMKLDPDSDSYIWPDAETVKINKPVDLEWLGFFNRYLTETNTGFHQGNEEI